MAADWYLYILINDQGICYTGISTDPERRLAEHNGGAGARFTRGRGPWRQVHQEGPMSHGDALRRECAVKADRGLKARLKAEAGR